MTKRNVRNFVMLSAISLMVAVAVWAQAMTQMTGTLIDKAGKPIDGAEVKITRTDIKANYNIKTDKNGKFLYATLPLGVYDVNITKGGDVILDLKGVKTDYSKAATLDIDQRKPPANAVAVPAGPTAAETEAAAKSKAEAEAKYAKEMKQYEEQEAKNKALQEAFNTGMEASRAKNWPVAIENLGKASQLDPTQHAVFGQLGEAYKAQAEATRGADRLANYTKASEAYAKAIALKPEDPTYHYNGSVAYARANKMTEAQSELDQAIKLEPANAARGYRNLGAVYFDTNRSEAAEGAFKKAIELDPNNPDAYFQLGLSMIGRATVNGDKMVAPMGTAEALQKYLELAPMGANAEDAKGMLMALGAPVATGINRAPPATTKGKAKGK